MSVNAQLAQGTTIKIDTVQIKEVKGIKPSGGSASVIDVTDLDSTAKESRTGLQDHGTLSLDIHILESDPGQTACVAAFAGSTSNTYVVDTGIKTYTFDGSITKWPTVPDATVDGVLVGTAEIKLSGAVTVAASV
jgi:hypothetical protein